MTISPAQCRAARAIIDMDQTALAKAAVVPRSVILDFEVGTRVAGGNDLEAIRRVLEAARVEFITRHRASGVMLRMTK
jgi:predicted transcriptional regulator